MLKLLSIKEQPKQDFVIDEETYRFREDMAINNQINQILKQDMPEWKTADLKEGLEMLQTLFLDRAGLPETYNKGITTAINRIIRVLQVRKEDFTLRIPKSLLPTY